MTDFTHPSLDDLADLHEGLLSPQRSAELYEHIGSCDTCSAAMAALDEVQALLADGAGASEIPMPASVADSLDLALGRASAERAAGVVSLSERRTTSDRHTPSERAESAAARRARWLRIVGAAAAVVVVGYGGVIALQHISGGSSSNSASSAARATSQDMARAGGGAHRLVPVTAKSLPRFANRLVANRDAERVSVPTSAAPAVRGLGPRRVMSAAECPSGAGGRHIIVAMVAWRGAPAVVVVDSKTHRVVVRACTKAAVPLYSTSF